MVQFLFVTDLDNTLVGDAVALRELNHHLQAHRQQHGTKIVYATGRSRSLYQALQAEQQLLEPDALVLSVGTEIYYQNNDTPDPAWATHLAQGWNREQVLAIAAQFGVLVPQPTDEQAPFKASYYLNQDVALEVLSQLAENLRGAGLDVQLVYSSGRDLDILPSQGNKGNAIAFLQQQWKMSPDRTVVCGDSGNDLSMFVTVPARGIIVGNAQPELLEWHSANSSGDRHLAQAHCAGGILEGLQHFGLLN